MMFHGDIPRVEQMIGTQLGGYSLKFLNWLSNFCRKICSGINKPQINSDEYKVGYNCSDKQELI